MRELRALRGVLPRMMHASGWRAPLAVLMGSFVLALTALQPVESAPVPGGAPPAHAVLGTFVRGPERVVAGTPAALRIATHWAASERESGPLGGVDVEVTMAGHGRRETLYRGRTDAAGLADARFRVPEWPDGKYTVTVTARAGARHDQRSHDMELQSGAKLLVESDKPLYQPGQVIHLRALAVRPQDGRPVAGRKITFDVDDPRGNRVFHEERTLSAFGVAAADFTLADEITLGGYRARAELADGPLGQLSLEVARYALPKFNVSLDADRPYYGPGDHVRLSLEARYFFGKPADGASVTVDAMLAGMQRLATLRGKLDKDGKTRFELAIPKEVPSGDLGLRLVAEVVDAAGHREHATRELPVAREPIALEIVSEAGHLLPGVENRIFVVATRPDGSPVKQADVQLAIEGAPPLRARTDGIGIATFTATPAPSRNARSAQCGWNRVQLLASSGARSESSCVALAGSGGLIVRTDRAIYPLGAPVEIDVAAPTTSGMALVDVVKDGQTVDTAAVALERGRGHLTLRPDERRFGTLALFAYRIGPDGSRMQDARIIYVERPSALKVEIHPQAETFRPGEPGRIRLHVVDAQSGKGVQASVGVVMVDRALLALRTVRPGAARTFMTLAEAATHPKLKHGPGGYTMERLVEEEKIDALRDEAAQVLLAGAAPPWSVAWEVDPWAERKQAWSEQQSRFQTVADAWIRKHPAGERVGKKWRWRRDLLAAMIADGSLRGRDRRDPWGRALSTDDLVQAAGLGDFASFAMGELEARLSQLYRSLPRKKELSRADLEKLLADKRPVDPWGTPLRIEERKKPVRIAGMKSLFVLASAGPDGVPGNKDDLYPVDGHCGLGRGACIYAATAGEAFGIGGLGTIGYGAGGGGYGVGYGRLAGRAASSPALVMGAAMAGGEARVRRDFPETMLWRPEVLTDEQGDATLEMTLADSITTWRLTAEAIASDGRLGVASADVRVFQDFFVDLDLPAVATQHDELSVPVAVYNYLPSPQRVSLELDDAPWFQRLGDRRQTIDLSPSQVGVRYFRIRIGGLGRQKLTVHASGSAASDAVERSLEIFPDGVERAVSFQDRIGAGQIKKTLDIPSDAIASASDAELKVYPGMASHVLEGLDSMLRMPGGCFEQTSSSNYPNALILDYLRRTGKSTPAIEKKARDYLAQGYQRLLSFEVRGGGFSWFGNAPANKILTAYGLEEFHDMARVFPVDKRVIERTQRWLVAQQKPDGSWAPDTYFINEGATNHFNSDAVRITSYIALALRRTGGSSAAVEKAMAFVRRKKAPEDAYTMALVVELLGSDADRLWGMRRDEGKTASFTTREKTPTYGDGKSGTVETTAIAAYALLSAPGSQLGRVDRAIGFLIGSKDSFGNWYSTQATIRSLQTLLAYESKKAQKGKGTLTVTVDGEAIAKLPIDGADDAMQVVRLPRAARPGAHAVELRYEGTGQLAYQLVGRYWEPHRKDAPAGDLAVSTTLDDDDVKPGQDVRADVRVVAKEAIDMPIVTAGLPPGFDVDGDELDRLVREHKVEKVQRTPREVVFYLRRLEPNQPVVLPVRLTAKFPVHAQVPAPTAYEYYRPERRGAGQPVMVTIRG